MIDPVQTVDADRSVRDAAEVFSDEGVGSLVVCGDDVRGLLTKTDVVDGLSEGIDPGEVSVASLMSSPLVTVAPDAELQAAVDEMGDHGIKHLAVERGGRVVGMVTTTDLVGHLADETDAVGLFAGLYDHGGSNTYECPACGARTENDQGVPTCPDCGESMRDLGLSRE